MTKLNSAGYFGRNLLDEATQNLSLNLPEIRRISLEICEIVFVPKVIGQQLILAMTIEMGVVTINQVLAVIRKIYSNFSSHSRHIRELEYQQQTAGSQDEWMDLAEKIDSIQGNDVWREEASCPIYESDRISSRVDEFVHLMRRRDIFDLMFTLRGGIARNKFGLLHEGLFSKALAGSKMMVETYHNVVCAALDFVCDAPVLPDHAPIPTDARLAFFNEARHSYGRTALMLSGGAALGIYHVGVVKALMENGLLPRVLSGASAGSIVCAMIGTRTDEECKQDLFEVKGTYAPGHNGKLMLDFFRPVETSLKRSRKNSSSKPSTSITKVLENTAGAFHDGKKTWQLLAPIGLRKFTSIVYDIITGHRRAKDLLKNDTEHFRNCCRTNIGNFTFQEAFDRTGRILNIIVSPQNRSDPPRLLNYLTAPHVLVWSAAVASSSLPGVFEPNKLLVKDADGTERYESAGASRFIDGSMEADLPMQQLSEMFNVNHFIISQANPHAVLLASFNVTHSVWSNRLLSFWHGVLLFLKKQIKAWIGNAIELIGGQRAAPMWDTRRGFGSQFFTQEYEGRDIDISLVPWASHRSLYSAMLHCIYNPSHAEFLEWARAAERETWRYIPKIKSHVAEEMTLDRCVQRLRKQLLAETIEARSSVEDTAEKMSQRVPSFFTSASLVNMSGLCITDNFSLDKSRGIEKDEVLESKTVAQNTIDTENQVDIAPGWKGMGLRGNHSSGSLNRSNSGCSGLFLMDEKSDDESEHAGELNRSSRGSFDASASDLQNGEYIKTSNMANFYYRNTRSNENIVGLKDPDESKDDLMGISQHTINWSNTSS